MHCHVSPAEFPFPVFVVRGVLNPILRCVLPNARVRGFVQMLHQSSPQFISASDINNCAVVVAQFIHTGLVSIDSDQALGKRPPLRPNRHGKTHPSIAT